MIQHELLIKLSGLKSNLQDILHKFKLHSSNENLDLEDFDGVDNYVDDLPLTLNREPGPDIKFYSTENSDLSKRFFTDGLDLDEFNK